MKNLLLLTLLVLTLASCTGSNSSVIVEIRSTGVFSNGDRVNDLKVFFSEIESPSSRNLVFMVNVDAKTQTLIDAMSVSKQFKFKGVSVSSL